MKNWVLCIAILSLLITGSFVFVIAQRMHHTQTEIASLSRAIRKERESLRVLQAEWTYLNNPARLERLATSLFALQPVDGKQYVALASMPTRVEMERIETAQVDITPEGQGLAITEKQNVTLADAAYVPSVMPAAMPVSMIVGGTP
jgi:cell division protein FtsL